MSITGSMFIAQTAIDAFSESMNITGHNIANLNTVGFKASRLEFADIMPSIWEAFESGHGVQIADATRSFRQGAIETTSSVTDLAVDGAGFFVLRDANGESFYTRAGGFHVDENGNLVNPSGLLVQGAAGNISLANLKTIGATPTTQVQLAFNLDASSVTPATPFPLGPDASENTWFSASNFSLVTPIFDDGGQSHDLIYLFRKSGPNTWDYRVVAARNELDPLALTSTELTQVSPGGTLTFTSNGGLDVAGSAIGDISGLSWVGGGTTQPISGTSQDLTGTVQYGRPSGLLSMRQDGAFEGRFTGLRIDGQGVITAQYSNGQSRLLDTLVLATFPNVEGLNPLGDSLLDETLESGAAQIAAAGQNGRGSILSGALELSTVDLAREFISLLVSQRSFQMNSRVITIADEMLTVATDLKT